MRELRSRAVPSRADFAAEAAYLRPPASRGKRGRSNQAALHADSSSDSDAPLAAKARSKIHPTQAAVGQMEALADTVPPGPIANETHPPATESNPSPPDQFQEIEMQAERLSNGGSNLQGQASSGPAELEGRAQGEGQPDSSPNVDQQPGTRSASVSEGSCNLPETIFSKEQLKAAIRTVLGKRTLSGSQSVLSVMPLGASVAFFAPNPQWQKYAQRAATLPSTLQSLTSFNEEDIVSLLFRVGQMLETRLLNSLKGKDWRQRSILRHAFRDDASRTSNPEFIHEFLTVVVADRMAWALSDTPADDDRPLPLPHMAPGEWEALNSKHSKVFDLLFQWDETIKDFLSIWAGYGPDAQPVQGDARLVSGVLEPPAQYHPTAGMLSDGESAGRSPSPNPSEDLSIGILQSSGTVAVPSSQCKDVVVTLAAGVEDTENRMRFAKVENHFCQAALALFALSQRESMRDPRNPNYKPPSLVDICREAFPGLPRNMQNMDDTAFLRPLYVVVCISPLCLLPLSHQKGSGVNRLTLQDLLTSLRLVALRPHAPRRDIEKSLLRSIMSMAVEGRDNFQRSMRSSIDLWREKRIVDGVIPRVERREIQPVFTTHQWSVQQGTNPLELQLVQALSLSIEGPGSDVRDVTVIDLTKDEGDDWLAEMVQKLPKVKVELEARNRIRKGDHRRQAKLRSPDIKPGLAPSTGEKLSGQVDGITAISHGSQLAAEYDFYDFDFDFEDPLNPGSQNEGGQAAYENAPGEHRSSPLGGSSRENSRPTSTVPSKRADAGRDPRHPLSVKRPRSKDYESHSDSSQTSSDDMQTDAAQGAGRGSSGSGMGAEDLMEVDQGPGDDELTSHIERMDIDAGGERGEDEDAQGETDEEGSHGKSGGEEDSKGLTKTSQNEEEGEAIKGSRRLRRIRKKGGKGEGRDLGEEADDEDESEEEDGDEDEDEDDEDKDEDEDEEEDGDEDEDEDEDEGEGEEEDAGEDEGEEEDGDKDEGEEEDGGEDESEEEDGDKDEGEEEDGGEDESDNGQGLATGGGGAAEGERPKGKRVLRKNRSQDVAERNSTTILCKPTRMKAKVLSTRFVPEDADDESPHDSPGNDKRPAQASQDGSRRAKNAPIAIRTKFRPGTLTRRSRRVESPPPEDPLDSPPPEEISPALDGEEEEESDGAGLRSDRRNPNPNKAYEDQEDIQFTHKLPRLFQSEPPKTMAKTVQFTFWRPRLSAEHGQTTAAEGIYEEKDFEQVTRSVQFWSAMAEDRKEIVKIMEKQAAPAESCADLAARTLQTVTRAYWDSIDTRRKHPRQCRDHTIFRRRNTPESHVTRQVTVREFVQDVEARKKGSSEPRRCCNILDIPLLHNCLPLELDHLSRFAHDDFPNWNPVTKLELKSLATQWGLAGHSGAYSRLHIDAAGYATHVYMIEGEKAWWTSRNKSYVGGLRGFNPAESEFDCALLSAGDELIMAPDTVHAVLTLQDSMALGGHFYNFVTMEETWRALVQEHYFGEVLTNTEHPKAPLLLMKGFMALAHLDYGPEEIPEQDDEPSAWSFAGLLRILLNLRNLGPNIPPDSSSCVWQAQADFIIDHDVVERNVLRVLSNHRQRAISGGASDLVMAIKNSEADFNSWVLKLELKRPRRFPYTSCMKYVQ